MKFHRLMAAGVAACVPLAVGGAQALAASAHGVLVVSPAKVIYSSGLGFVPGTVQYCVYPSPPSDGLGDGLLASGDPDQCFGSQDLTSIPTNDNSQNGGYEDSGSLSPATYSGMVTTMVNNEVNQGSNPPTAPGNPIWVWAENGHGTSSCTASDTDATIFYWDGTDTVHGTAALHTNTFARVVLTVTTNGKGLGGLGDAAGFALVHNEASTVGDCEANRAGDIGHPITFVSGAVYA
ncbi:MAG: hypothetical protein ACYDAY_09460 [Candidatus Dormibacteria bacterium]